MNVVSRRLNRRTLLALATVGLGGIALPVGAEAWVRTARHPPAAVPAPAPPLAGLPTGPPPAEGVEVTLTATSTAVALDGATVPLSFDGTFPGPLLRFHDGDHVRLTFVNRLDAMTNLHLHGLHIPPAVDDPFVHLMPGESRLYEFTVPAGAAGTYWYHPHEHGALEAQIRGGLVGPLVIAGPPDDLPELQAAQDELLVFTALGGRGRGAGGVLVNGRPQATATATSPTVRLRLLNASADTFLRLGLEELTAHLVATDGGFIAEPVPLDEIALAPGERAEVLAQVSQPGSYGLTALPFGAFGRGGGVGSAAPVWTLTVASAMSPAPLPRTLATVPPLDPADAVATRRIVLDGGFRIDGQRFDEDRVDVQARLGTLEVWEIENASGQRHAFHLHTYSFQVLARNDQPEPYAAWRDVVALPPGDRVRLAIPFADFGGKTVFHCHVARHNDRGMMAVLEVAVPTS
ncbi:MAG TPA: multicopper oxidase family protein [Chloroflexota bacterium]|nr:multicopper oxidase family protein [Chloroflexota bacterium]